jgi:AraC family transcriptional regulator of adaptative response/methylated-DNA-[protein]-cysteine methyltransferase
VTAAARRHCGARDSERMPFAVVPCRLGSALIAMSTRGLVAVLLGDDPAALRSDLRRRFPRATLVAGGASLERCARAVVACVDGTAAAPRLPLDLRGTAFQRRVWRALQRVPAGRTIDYGSLARSLGTPGGARAVAQACAANPLAVVVPCHRVVAADGALSG